MDQYQKNTNGGIVPPPDAIRPEFIAAMRHEINANARKGDWSQFKINADDVPAWLGEHVSKLFDAVADGDAIAVREYAADVANIAMKIDECFGVRPRTLEPQPVPPVARRAKP